MQLETSLFDEVADVVRGMVPPALGSVHHRSHRYGIKVWFDSSTPTREHYEAQVIGPKEVRGAKVLALEVGFHAEHPKVADNEAVIARLMTREKQWRRVLGAEAEVGPFLGRRDDWRRVSETWPDPDLGAEELAVQLGARLVDYVTALEPARRATRKSPGPGSAPRAKLGG
jgi:hypothetical protein